MSDGQDDDRTRFTVQRGRHEGRLAFYIGVPMQPDDGDRLFWIIERDAAERLWLDLEFELGKS